MAYSGTVFIMAGAVALVFTEATQDATRFENATSKMVLEILS